MTESYRLITALSQYHAQLLQGLKHLLTLLPAEHSSEATSDRVLNERASPLAEARKNLVLTPDQTQLARRLLRVMTAEQTPETPADPENDKVGNDEVGDDEVAALALQNLPLSAEWLEWLRQQLGLPTHELIARLSTEQQKQQDEEHQHADEPATGVLQWAQWQLSQAWVLQNHIYGRTDALPVLCDDLNEHVRRYEQGQPILTDAAFDDALVLLKCMEQQHPSLIRADSPSQSVSPLLPQSETPRVRHLEPMLSLANAFSDEQVLAFDRRIRRYLDLSEHTTIEYTVEHKLDGIGVNLQYRKRKLDRAVSRGDGAQGDDISAAIIALNAVPTLLPEAAPELVEVRAEAIFLRSDFAKLTEGAYKNARNAVAGLLRLQQTERLKHYPIRPFCYRLFIPEQPELDHHQGMSLLAQWGFLPDQAPTLYRNIEACLGAFKQMEQTRSAIPYEVDGLVYKVNRGDWQRRLGTVGKHLRWALAHKFKAEEVSTRLLDIGLQVGRTGTVTPVAHLEAVQVSGVTIRHASLHNFDRVAQLKLSVGDRIVVRRAGEVIPEIVEVIASAQSNYTRRPERSQWRRPTHCPVCATELKWRVSADSSSGKLAYCPAWDRCEPQIVGRLQHFCSRQAMQIDGFGVKVISALVHSNRVRTPVDLYDLSVEELCSLERVGPVLAQKLHQHIAASKRCELHRLIYALGIPECGSETSLALANAFGGMEPLMNAGVSELEQVPGIGVRAQAMVEYLQHPNHKAWIMRLLPQLQVAAEPSEERGTLTGLRLAISGKFEHYSRTELAEQLRKKGARVMSTLTKDTHYFLTGTDPSAAKVKKSTELGIARVDAQGVERLLRTGSPDEPA